MDMPCAAIGSPHHTAQGSRAMACECAERQHEETVCTWRAASMARQACARPAASSMRAHLSRSRLRERCWSTARRGGSGGEPGSWRPRSGGGWGGWAAGAAAGAAGGRWWPAGGAGTGPGAVPPRTPFGAPVHDSAGCTMVHRLCSGPTCMGRRPKAVGDGQILWNIPHHLIIVRKV